MILDGPVVDLRDFEARTGWEIRPEGACKGDICVSLPDTARVGGGLDVRTVADRLGMPLVVDESRGISALGPEAGVNGRTLATARAPELELPDAEGNPFRLSSLLGRKVLLVAWASW